jgi:transcriptional regulator with XRE-family HTH domain
MDDEDLADLFVAARTRAKLSQVEVAKRMGTAQSTIAHLESGRARPSLSTLRKFAEATDTVVQVDLVPKKRRRSA